jgi:hypothetical protein
VVDRSDPVWQHPTLQQNQQRVAEAQRPSQILSAIRQHIDSTASRPMRGMLATAPTP